MVSSCFALDIREFCTCAATTCTLQKRMTFRKHNQKTLDNSVGSMVCFEITQLVPEEIWHIAWISTNRCMVTSYTHVTLLFNEFAYGYGDLKERTNCLKIRVLHALHNFISSHYNSIFTNHFQSKKYLQISDKFLSNEMTIAVCSSEEQKLRSRTFNFQIAHLWDKTFAHQWKFVNWNAGY